MDRRYRGNARDERTAGRGKRDPAEVTVFLYGLSGEQHHQSDRMQIDEGEISGVSVRPASPAAVCSKIEELLKALLNENSDAGQDEDLPTPRSRSISSRPLSAGFALAIVDRAGGAPKPRPSRPQRRSLLPLPAGRRPAGRRGAACTARPRSACG